MEDSEKLTALKKAYADIILNTAKEAAARIMVSERKAMRFQRELVDTKEEALRMLVRLKQIMDAKAIEAEKTSLKQREKIEELEAQLEEAEEIVKDLREDLRVTQSELEKVTKNQIHSHVQQLVGSEKTATQEEMQQDKLSSCNSTYYVPGDAKRSMTDGALEGSKCYVAHDHINSCFVDSPDFASIMIRRKEPELYKNGCTHRIRAFGRSLLETKLSVSGQRDDRKSELFITGEENKEMSTAPCSKGDDVHGMEKNSGQELMLKDNAYFQQLANKAFHLKRKRETRYNKRKSFPLKLHQEEVDEMQNSSELLCAENSLDNESGGNTSVLDKNRALKDSSPTVHYDSPAIAKHSGVMEDAEGNLGSCFAMDTVDGGKELTDKSDLSRQDRLSADNWVMPYCGDGNRAPDNLEQKESDLEDKVPCQSDTSNFLKYSRKRKKQSLSGPDCSLEKCSSKKQAAEQQNGHVEPHKSCNNTELSHDSRRLAQVALELVSMSEKKWWQ